LPQQQHQQHQQQQPQIDIYERYVKDLNDLLYKLVLELHEEKMKTIQERSAKEVKDGYQHHESGDVSDKLK